MPWHGRDEEPYFPEGTPLRTRVAALVSVLFFLAVMIAWIFAGAYVKTLVTPSLNRFNAHWIGWLESRL
jgi:hypothetical protein